jgi:hypothetical protein
MVNNKYIKNLFNSIHLLIELILVKQGELNIRYNYSFIQSFNIKKSNLFWRFVDILACRMKRVALLYEEIIGVAYREEKEKFVLSNSKKLLHIGGGDYPITAIILSEKNDVNITIIDNNRRAVKAANKVLKKKSLNGKIKALKGDGSNFSLNGFDAIIVSGCSVPKVKVLEHILKDSEPNCKIIIRDSYLNIEKFINNMNPKQNIIIIDKLKFYPFPTSYWYSYYLEKNG